MENNSFHFVGIGGIGMSALARLLKAKNYKVTGSDHAVGKTVQALESEGFEIFKTHEAKNIANVETTVIYSSAISEANPEIKQAKALNCPLWHRSDLLAFIMKPYQSILVTGTHGKTTTSSMMAHVLSAAGQSPSFMIGGLIQPQNTNGCIGTGPYFVAEADESDKSFLKYFPDYAIITNIESDHLDNYQDLKDIENHFAQFIKQIKSPAHLLWCYDCPQLRSLNPTGISYGYEKGAALHITNARQNGWGCIFDLSLKGVKYANIELSTIGDHNILNAAAVFGIALMLGINEEDIRKGLSTFVGAKRRSEKIGEYKKIQIYDDYGHHPTEIACLLRSFRKTFPKRKIIALFQPHRYSRFIPFKDDFIKSFHDANEVWITDVYAAGEVPKEHIDMRKYAQALEANSKVKTKYINRAHLVENALNELKPFDILITIGAGDITNVGPQILTELPKKNVKLKLGLICGSVSHEHYISLVSSRFYLNEYDKELYEMQLFKILPSGQWVIIDQEKQEHPLNGNEEIVRELSKCQVVLLSLHGRRGEDGMLQGFLQTLNIAHGGTSYEPSSLNMNKIWMKAMVQSLNIPTAKGVFFPKDEWIENAEGKIHDIESKLAYPLVAKPACSGSTVGVHFVKNTGELKQAIEHIIAIDDFVVIEEQIFSRELEVSCLDTEEGLVIPHPGGVKSDVRQYDYHAKYSVNPIEKVVHAEVSDEVANQCRQYAKTIYKNMGINSYCRIDFFLTFDNKVIFAEVNTLPGMTPRSLFQRTLIAHGIKPDEIINQMVINALYQHEKRIKKVFEIEQIIESFKDVTHQKQTAS